MATTLKERAAKLGRDNPALLPGEVIDSLIPVDTIDHLKQILDEGDGPAGRARRVKAMFQGITQPTEGEAGLLRRVHEFIFGNAKLSAQDRELVKPAFPLTVRAITAVDKTINSQWDLGKSGPPVVMHFGTLTINQGGYVTIGNTVLTLTIDNLVRNGDAGIGTVSDFNILGVSGSKGGPGATPPPPDQAQNGASGQCISIGVAGEGGQQGYPGATGTVGGTGGPGGKGFPSLPATITINTSISGTAERITIATQSGPGGNGGPGGTGSVGGQGGWGGNGVTCNCTANGGGNGGQGGTGGAGGVGGPGGDGINAAGNVIVNVPAAYLDKIVPIRNTARAGSGGGAGAGGAGGPGGNGGPGGKHQDGGQVGSQGTTGAPGSAGHKGAATGTPAEIIIHSPNAIPNKPGGSRGAK